MPTIKIKQGGSWKSIAGSVDLDSSLTQKGMAADAKAVGEALNNIQHPITTVNGKIGDVVITPADIGAASTDTYKGVFLYNNWTDSIPYTQTITIPGLLSTDYPFVDIDLSDVSDASSVIDGWNMVGRCTVAGDNTVIAFCYEEKPLIDIPIIFKVVR